MCFARSGRRNKGQACFVPWYGFGCGSGVLARGLGAES